MEVHGAATWIASNEEELLEKAQEVEVLQTADQDIRSLRELITYGVKGIAAYSKHSSNLGYEDQEVYDYMQEALAAITDDSLTVDDLVKLALKSGKFGTAAMSLLDQVNSETYSSPEITEVNIGTRDNPAILISGHDLLKILN